MTKYLANIYKEVIVLHRNNYESEYIIKYKPDIVIREFVERYQNDILKKMEIPKEI